MNARKLHYLPAPITTTINISFQDEIKEGRQKTQLLNTRCASPVPRTACAGNFNGISAHKQLMIKGKAARSIFELSGRALTLPPLRRALSASGGRPPQPTSRNRYVLFQQGFFDKQVKPLLNIETALKMASWQGNIIVCTPQSSTSVVRVMQKVSL